MSDPLIQAGNTAAQSVQNPNAPVGTDPNAAMFAANNNNLSAPQNSTSPTVLTPGQAFNNTKIDVPKVTSPDPSGAILGNANQTVDTITKALTPQTTELDNQNQSLLNDVATLTGQDSGKAQSLLDLQKQTGATQAGQDLKDLNNQLLIKTAAYNKQFADIGAQGLDINSSVTNAQMNGLKRSQAADIGLLTAQIQAKQGDLKLALDTAQSANDAKYSVIEDNIKTKLAQIQALMPKLEAQQRTQALAQQKLLEDQQQKVADEKAAAKENLGLALTAGVSTKFTNKNGQFFDTATGKPFETPQDFFKAAGVSSFEEAYQKGLVSDVSNSKLQDINFVQQAQAKYPDAGIKLTDTPEEVTAKLQGSKIYQKDTNIARPVSSGGSIGSSRTNPVTTVSGGNVVAGVTLPSNVSATDVQAVLEGRETALDIRQTVGRSKEGDAKMQALRDAIFKIDPKFDFVASNAGGKLVSSTYYQKSQAAINSVLPNIDKIVDLSNQVSRVGVSGVDKILQSGKVQIGNKAVANFHEAQKLIADEIGLALGAGSVSDMKLQLGFDVTDPSVSPEVFASNMEIVKEFIQNRKKGLEDQRYQSSTVPSGEIRVKEKSSGTTGTIDASEFDPNLYDKLP